MALVVAILGVALFMDGGTPGPAGWIAIGLSALGALYEDRWTFDAEARQITHRSGLVLLARRRTIGFGEAQGFRVAPFVRGTVPGSIEEGEENAAALRGGRADDSGRRRARHKKPYLCLLCESEDGSRYFINAVGARRGDSLKAEASRIAELCGRPLVIG